MSGVPHQVKADTEKRGPFGLPGRAMLPIPHLPGDSLDTDDFVSARVVPWDRSSVWGDDRVLDRWGDVDDTG